MKPKLLFVASLFICLVLLSISDSAKAQLPNSFVVTVDKGGGEMVELNLSKHSIRSSDFRVQSWDSANGYVVEHTATSPMMPVRTYRGFVTQNPNELVTAIVDVDNALDATVHNGSGRVWTVSNVDVTTELGNGNSNMPAPAPLTPGSPASGSMAGGVPTTYLPPIGIYTAHGVYDIPSSYYKGSVDASLAWLEYQWNIHDFFNTRDAKLNIQLSEVIVRKEQFYTPDNGNWAQFNSMLRTEWQAQGQNDRGFIGSSFPTGFSYAGGYAVGNNFYVPGGEAICINALYHENGHNWRAQHWLYGQDTMSGSHPAHGEMNSMRVLFTRQQEIDHGDISQAASYATNIHPRAFLDATTTQVDTPVNISPLENDWDANGDTISLKYFTANTVQGGIVSESGGVLTYTPAAGYVGKDVIVYEVQDTAGLYTQGLVHIEVINHGLAAHWAFEESTGQTAADSSGNSHPGVLSGTSFEVGSIAGPVGNAIYIDSGQGIEFDNTDLIAEAEDHYPLGSAASNFFDPMDQSYTVACWFMVDDLTDKRTLVSKRNRGGIGFELSANSSGLEVQLRPWDGNSSTLTVSGGAVYENMWQHGAMVINRSDNTVRAYLNGVEVGTAATLPADIFIFAGRTDLTLGEGAFDEVRVYTKALSVAEIQALQSEGTAPVGDPAPATGGWRVGANDNLFWRTPDSSYIYNVYFGTDQAAVTNATTASPEYQGQFTSTSFDPGAMANSSTYYWRVDAVTASQHVIPGAVWAFTTVIDEATLASNLLAHWAFDEGAGSSVGDSSGNGLGGTIVGGGSWTNGQFGGALQFDGVDDAVDLSSHVAAISALGQGTMTVWFRSQGTSAHVMFSVSDSTDASSEARFYVEGNSARYDFRDDSSEPSSEGGYLDSQNINDGAWHHAAITVDSLNNAILYIDGVQSDTEAEPFFAGLLGANSVSIGRNVDSGGPQWHFVGDIDDMRIYNRPLTPAEIDHLGSGVIELPAMAQWKFDDGSGSVVSDSSAHQRDGLVNGAAWISGNDGGALSFNGSSDHVDLTAHVDAVNGFTSGAISTWFRTTSSFGVIFSGSDTMDGSSEGRLFVETGLIRYDFRDDTASPDGEGGMLVGPNVTDGEWHHVVVSVDTNNAATMYLDGVVVASEQEPWVGELDGINSMSLGRNVDSGGPQWYFNGDIDETMLYRRALSAGEVQTIHGGVNNLPAWNSSPVVEVNATEDVSYNTTLADDVTDADSDSLTFSKVTGPAWLSVASDGALSGTPANGDVGLSVFTVQVDDGNGGVVSANLHVTVINSNDAPTANDTSGSVAENTAVGATVATVTAADPDVGDSVTFAITAGNTGNAFAINASTGAITTAAVLDYEVASGYSLTVTATDNGGLSDTATVSVAVTNVNEAPAASDATLAVAENLAAGASVGTVFTSDPDAGDTLTYTITAGNGGGEFAINSGTGAITTTTAFDYEDTNSYALVIMVTDAGSLSDTATITVDVTNVNEAPSANDTSGSVAETVAIGTSVVTVVSSDPDAGDSITYAITAGNTGDAFAINATTGEIVTAAVLDYETTPSYTLTITATDSGGLTETAVVTVTVNDVVENAIATWNLDENSGTIASDTSGNSYDGSVSGAAWANGYYNGGLTFDGTDDYLDLTPHTEAISGLNQGTIAGWIKTTGTGAYSIFTASDTTDGSSEVRFFVEGGAIRYDFRDDSSAPAEEAGMIVGPAVNDGTWHHVAVTVDSSNNATIYLDGASVTSGLEPFFSNLQGINSMSIGRNVDSGGGQWYFNGDMDDIRVYDYAMNAAAVTALYDSYGSGNDAPAWAAEPVAEVDATVGVVYSSTLADDALDPDSDPLGFAKVSGPAWLNVAANGALSGTPTSGDLGANVFIVQVDDGKGGSAQATLNITVVSVNGAPGANDATFAVAEDAIIGTSVGTVVATDPDAGDTLSYTITSGNGGGEFSVNSSTGEITTVAALDYETTAQYVLTVTVTDDGIPVLDDTAIIYIDATDVAEVPSPKLIRTTVNGVGNGSWTTVNLGQSYTSAVIIATPIYPNTTTPPVVTRITNVSGSSFDLKIDRADGLTDAVTIDVSIIAVEEGVYTQATDGVTMEAVKYTSTVTADNNSWVGETQTYQNTYTAPVVVGQVMSANDANWSVFYSMGNTRTAPASASVLNVGKHVGEDPNATRANETIGYIVIESGSGTINGVAYEAALGADTVRGFGNSSSPYTYTLSGGLSTVSAAAASISGMDGNNGAWAVLSGSPAMTTSSLGLHALEDQMNDAEQSHTTTQVGYIVFE